MSDLSIEIQPPIDIFSVAASFLLFDWIEPDKGKISADDPFSIRTMTEASIKIDAYIRRIHIFTNGDYSSCVLALATLSKYLDSSKTRLTENRMHKLFFTAYVIACKFNSDEFSDNRYYARVGGISVIDLNRMELSFLKFTSCSIRIADLEYIATAYLLNSYITDKSYLYN